MGGQCGAATYTPTEAGAAAVPLNCAGPRHALFRDMDGSMLQTGGVAAAIAGNLTSSSAGRLFPYDQGTPLAHGPCTYLSAWSGYRCLAGQDSFITPPMNLALKPDPVPAAGIFGDPQLFVLESLDADSETRDLSPVLFNVSGSVDLLVPPFDHSWCFEAFCRKRMSTFWTSMPTGQEANVTFTRTPPLNMRLWLPYADPAAEVVLVGAVWQSHSYALPSRCPPELQHTHTHSHTHTVCLRLPPLLLRPRGDDSMNPLLMWLLAYPFRVT